VLVFQLGFYAGLVYEHEAQQEQYFNDLSFEDTNADHEPAEGEPSEPSKGDELPVELNKDKQYDLLFEDHGYLLSRLTLVSITDFCTECNEDMQVLEFILRKATMLELLNLTLISRFVEMEPLRGRLSCIPSASPNLKIDIRNKLTAKPRKFKTYQHLWDF